MQLKHNTHPVILNDRVNLMCNKDSNRSNLTLHQKGGVRKILTPYDP